MTRPATPRILPFLLPGLGDILWIAAFIGVIGLGPRMMNIDGDLGRHLTVGKTILMEGQVPLRDLFSHTMAGEPVTPHEWLAQVIFALSERWMGLDGVIIVCGLLIATTFCLVYRQARERSQGVLVPVFVTIFAIAASSLHWLSRPHVFTFLMLALWLGVLERMRCGRLGRWWQLPLLMLAWANLHGAFIAGFVTWGLFGLGLAWDAFWQRQQTGRATGGAGLHGHFWRYYFLGGAASFLVTLLNPSGIGLWATSVGYIGNRYLVSHTAEYLPPNFHDSSTWPFLLMTGLLVVLLGLQSKRLEAAHVLPAAAWLVMGLYSVRNAPLFAIVAAPLLATTLSDWWTAHYHRARLLSGLYRMDRRLLTTERSLRGFLWPALVLLLIAAGLRSGTPLDFQQQGNRFDAEVFPVQAVDWLAQHPQQGRMFNYFPWGGYLLYRLWPEQRVFIDGQTDFYGEELTRQYEQVLTVQPGWEAVLDQYGVDWMLIPPDQPLTGVLREAGGWSEAYEDETAVIFVRAGE